MREKGRKSTSPDWPESQHCPVCIEKRYRVPSKQTRYAAVVIYGFNVQQPQRASTGSGNAPRRGKEKKKKKKLRIPGVLMQSRS